MATNIAAKDESGENRNRSNFPLNLNLPEEEKFVKILLVSFCTLKGEEIMGPRRRQRQEGKKIAIMFQGQGAQRLGMASGVPSEIMDKLFF